MLDTSVESISPVSDHQLSLLDLPSVPELEACIRCGLCLSVCPTYRPTQVETKSPRGRIALVKNLVEGGLDLDDRAFAGHMDLCLQCMACHTVCPTGISAGEVVARAKSYLRVNSRPSWPSRLARSAIYAGLFPHYRRMELAALPILAYHHSGVQKLARRTGLTRLLPARLRRMEELLPSRLAAPLRPRLPALTPAKGDQRAEVAFHLTCINNIVLPEGSAASIRVLAYNGCAVRAPRGVACCGAPHETEGEMELARKLARHNIALYEKLGTLPVISDAAACGAAMKNYGHWLAGDPAWADRAAAFSARVRDFHQYLVTLGLRPPTGEMRRIVTYDDPCHLCHAQGISAQPRMLLRAIPGLRYVELRDAAWCCGSAGTYNLSQPAMADAILEEKMARIRETGATIIASANPGCLLQLEAGLRRFGLPGRVVHVSQLLDASYRKGAARGARA
ncbi:MAG TPA: (Fe-S)-binding protein [Chloroflexota bacterium]|nr:(Fe-S)-binding protein [Chloroflexota bacterium]